MQEGHSRDASLRSKLNGLSAKNRAGDSLCPLPRPFGYLQAISSGRLINSHTVFGHAAHILLGSVSLHVTSGQNGETCNHTH